MEEELIPLKEKFINPFSDVGFKMIFGSEVSKELIIKFLNSLLNEGITDITFRNVEALGMGRNDRKAIFDIFCETDKHEMIIVEMQKSSQKYFSDRVLYYAPSLSSNRLLTLKNSWSGRWSRKQRMAVRQRRSCFAGIML